MILGGVRMMNEGRRHVRFRRHSPSSLVAAVVCLGRRITNRRDQNMESNLSLADGGPPCPRISLAHVTSKYARGEALRGTRVDRIRAHVDAQLADPLLSAQMAARALGMSVRSLHLALAPTGESF